MSEGERGWGGGGGGGGGAGEGPGLTQWPAYERRSPLGMFGFLSPCHEGNGIQLLR